ADDTAALKHADLELGAGEIGRADQAVVAAADDEDVAVVIGHLALRRSRSNSGWHGQPFSRLREKVPEGRMRVRGAAVRGIALRAPSPHPLPQAGEGLNHPTSAPPGPPAPPPPEADPTTRPPPRPAAT